jgi:hypothetical protein
MHEEIDGGSVAPLEIVHEEQEGILLRQPCEDASVLLEHVLPIWRRHS